MNRFSESMMRAWVGLGARYLPFADAATADVPLSRLLRLSLFQVSAGMSLVLLVGTLNRVMIVELGVPASLVAVMLALPLVFAPLARAHRIQVGHAPLRARLEARSLHLPGTMVQFGGLAIMPFALLVLAHQGHAAALPAWVGQAAAGLAFLLVGAGLHITQTVGLALATDLTPPERQPNVVGLMYVALLFGSIVSALIFGALLADFTPGRLVQVIQGVGRRHPRAQRHRRVEAGGARRRAGRCQAAQRDPTFQESWACFIAGDKARQRLAAVGLGTLAFSMQDVMLEPYGGQVLGLAVSRTTLLTAAMAGGGLVGFSLASYVLSRGFDPFRMAAIGAWVGVPAFVLIIVSGFAGMPAAVRARHAVHRLRRRPLRPWHADRHHEPRAGGPARPGARRLGRGAGHGGGHRRGLGGIIRDTVAALTPSGALIPYVAVYTLEVILLLAAIVAMMRIVRSPVSLRAARRHESPHRLKPQGTPVQRELP